MIAMVTMTIDHIGHVFFPTEIMWRIVGRTAFPIFAFLCAEGAWFAHDRKKYIGRLLLCALISEIPFNLLATGELWSLSMQNVCWTLAVGVACCWFFESQKPTHIAAAVALLVASAIFMTDYSFVGALTVPILYNFNKKGKRMLGVAAECVLLSVFFGFPEIFCFMALMPLFFYNSKQGPRFKYLFYAFYPVHMLLIWIAHTLVMGGGM